MFELQRQEITKLHDLCRGYGYHVAATKKAIVDQYEIVEAQWLQWGGDIRATSLIHDVYALSQAVIGGPLLDHLRGVEMDMAA